MKEGWQIKNIGELCEVIPGQSPKSKFYNKNGDGLPFYQGKKEFTEKYIDGPKTWTTNITKEAQKDDILMSVRAPVGPVNFATQKICIGRGLSAIRAGNKVDKLFLFHFLVKHKNEITGNNGAVFNSINRDQIKAIQLPLPPLPEQKRIVAILDEAFAAIDKARANAEKNLANSKELFESYLNRIFANPGEDWEEKKLGDVCVKIQDGAHASPKKLYSNKGQNRFLYITSKNIRNNYIDLSNVSYCDESFHGSIYPRCNPEFGDLLLTKDGANTGNVTQNTIDEQFSLLSSVCLIKTRRAILIPEFLKYFIQSPIGFKQITGKMTGAAIKRIILKTIKDATVTIPSISKQEQIVDQLNTLSTVTKQLESIYQQKITALEELKKSILKKAFEGEL